MDKKLKALLNSRLPGLHYFDLHFDVYQFLEIMLFYSPHFDIYQLWVHFEVYLILTPLWRLPTLTNDIPKYKIQWLWRLPIWKRQSRLLHEGVNFLQKGVKYPHFDYFDTLTTLTFTTSDFPRLQRGWPCKSGTNSNVQNY